MTVPGRPESATFRIRGKGPTRSEKAPFVSSFSALSPIVRHCPRGRWEVGRFPQPKWQTGITAARGSHFSRSGALRVDHPFTSSAVITSESAISPPPPGPMPRLLIGPRCLPTHPVPVFRSKPQSIIYHFLESQLTCPDITGKYINSEYPDIMP